MAPKTGKACWKYTEVFKSTCAAPQPPVALAIQLNGNNFKGALARAGRYADVTLNARPASHRANAPCCQSTQRSKPSGLLHFLHSVSAATSLSTRVTSLKRFLWVSRTISGSPPLSVRNRSKSSTIFPRARRLHRERRLVEWARSRTDVSSSRVARYRSSSCQKTAIAVAVPFWDFVYTIE